MKKLLATAMTIAFSINLAWASALPKDNSKEVELYLKIELKKCQARMNNSKIIEKILGQVQEKEILKEPKIGVHKLAGLVFGTDQELEEEMEDESKSTLEKLQACKELERRIAIREKIKKAKIAAEERANIQEKLEEIHNSPTDCWGTNKQ